MGLETLSVDTVKLKNGIMVYGNILNENTPIGRGVVHSLRIYSLFGGHKPEFIPVYMIYATLGRSDCGYEVKIGNDDYRIQPHNIGIPDVKILGALADGSFRRIDK